ncbi:MAG: DUF2974 domain-containing protein [Mogibacterium sp.]|nr:DUF2974 domain-containing protein [Mogibacterium sp.]
MSTIFEYLDWRGDVPFDADPFNDVDNIVLAELAYSEFDGIVPEDGTQISLSEVCEAFFTTHTREELIEDDNPIAKAPLLMDGMLSGGRFGSMMVSDYVNIIDTERSLQFSAMTFWLSDGTAYIAYRGTDSTIVGWKEDFNMSYLPETGGQREAIEYLNKVASGLDIPIRVGGHSKGGNFAVYASAFCDSSIKDKILNVYSNDGPGFRSNVMEAEDYKSILPKVISIVPDTSIIGMLLTSKVENHVVKSSAFGLMQHDCLTWQVARNRFESAELSELGQFIFKTQVDWLSKIDDNSRELFVNTLFSLFESTGMGTFGKMSDNKLKSAESIISTLTGLPRERQKEMKRILRELLSSSKETAKESINDSLNDLISDKK